MTGLCVALALGATVASVPAERFMLSWTHSVEKILWEEDYRVVPEGLVVERARVRGSGAGMEAPEGARWRDGAWEYQPPATVLRRLQISYSGYAGDYLLCWAGQCRALGALLADKAQAPATIELFPCELP